MTHRLISSLTALWCCLLQAQPLPPGITPQAQQAVQAFLQQHPSLQQRSFSFQWKPLAPGLPLCAQAPRVEGPRQDRAWGTIRLKLACETGAAGWIRSVAIVVKVPGRYPVARHPLRAGSVVQAEDVEWRDGDLARWGEPPPESLDSLEGLELFRHVAAGAVLRLNDFRAIAVIRSGDLVSLSLKGQGFEMITTGYALADASVGVTVRVKTLEGKILQGRAVSAGKVEAVLD